MCQQENTLKRNRLAFLNNDTQGGRGGLLLEF